LIDDTLARLISCAKPLDNKLKYVISIKHEEKLDDEVVYCSW